MHLKEIAKGIGRYATIALFRHATSRKAKVFNPILAFAGITTCMGFFLERCIGKKKRIFSYIPKKTFKQIEKNFTATEIETMVKWIAAGKPEENTDAVNLNNKLSLLLKKIK